VQNESVPERGNTAVKTVLQKEGGRKEKYMTLIESIIINGIYLDVGSEVVYGSDQIFETYPCRFPTVCFELMGTYMLTKAADVIREFEGVEKRSPDGYYNFYFGINDYSKSKADVCISFVVVDEAVSDNESEYLIALSQYEQELMYDRLDEQCRKYLGKSCEMLLAEARKQMEGKDDGSE
jgi:hypothetical protein